MDKQMIEEMHKEYVEWALGLLKTRFDLKPEFYDVHHHDNFTYECGAESLWVKIESAMKELLWLRERQLPEGAVVLTREEYDDMFSFKTTRGGFYNILDTVRKVERKETAEKFAEMAEVKAIKARVNIDDRPRNDSFIFLSDIDEICKELVEGMK